MKKRFTVCEIMVMDSGKLDHLIDDIGRIKRQFPEYDQESFCVCFSRRIKGEGLTFFEVDASRELTSAEEDEAKRTDALESIMGARYALHRVKELVEAHPAFADELEMVIAKARQKAHVADKSDKDFKEWEEWARQVLKREANARGDDA